MAYPAEVAPAGPGATIASVDEGGPAVRAGLAAGEIVVAADGHALRDVIDWMWIADGESVALDVQGSDGARRRVLLEREWDEGWGMAFVGAVFDGIRECDNACAFCFVAQLPPGLRRSLYVRDDDFRLSFLAGNFVTLTNVDEADVDRIVEQRLSPLHVSVHAVGADVRRTLMCPTVEDHALERLEELLDAGIEVHVQIVAVPGANDGPVLERTLEWLAARDGILSVGVVPLGYTRFQRRYSRSFEEPAAAREIVDALEPWRSRMLAERGLRWVHAADELYLAAGLPLPPWEAYDGFPQFENGIGMARAFVDELNELASAGPSSRVPAPVVLVTGESFAPVLRSLEPALRDLGAEPRVLAVRNSLLGGNVSVAGLLAGTDISAAIRSDGGAGPFLVPDAAVNDDGLFLDDLKVGDIAASTRSDVRLVSSDAAGLALALTELA